MLKYIKKQIKELLDTMEEAKQTVKAAVLQGEEGELLNILADAQEAAVVIGTKIEASEEAAKDECGYEITLTQKLESYCELLWQLTQEETTEKRLDRLEEAWALLGGVRQGVQVVPDQFAIVFMPYKASMWDCMESVWRAACEDPDWVPFVVPIPYVDLKDGEIIASHYEGGGLPPDVPVEAYSDFPFAQMHPDAIYIHNPFDDYNIVTTVLPQFYSAELKKITDRLIYCPYYVTGEGVYVTHRELPSYGNMDFIVTQCEKMIESYSAQIPREKFLPFGSPIGDRILRMEKEKPPIPDAWKAQLENGEDFGQNRVVMLNTSISLLMKQRERFLDKIEYLIKLAKETKGITLVWRPHPLLHATARTMGESYEARLASLENMFLEEKIGVLDQTQDVGVTVALCDAYLGETASSMIHMFGIAGKPRFYIDLQLTRSREEGEDSVLVSGFCQTRGKEYFLLDRSGWILEKDKDTGGQRLLVRIPGRDTIPGRAYRGMELRDAQLWVYPEQARGIFVYNLETGRRQRVFGDKMPEHILHLRSEKKDLACESAESETESLVCGSERTGTEKVGTGADEIFIKVDGACFAAMRAEAFQRGNMSHEWYENEKNSVEDFFHFLGAAGKDELTGHQGAYLYWLATLDGSCGRKILQAVKESLRNGKEKKR